MIGADEAGRGPVLGSMFAAAVAAPADALPPGVDDSKRLAPERRERLAARLRGDDRIAVGLAEVPVGRIDDPETDMGGLTLDAQADAIRQVAAAGERVVADAGDVDAARFARRLRDRLDADLDVTAEHGADAAHAIVGAASIVAKVAREDHVDALAAEHGAVGSGYPGDPTTREFLDEYIAEYGALPPCARASWATAEDALAAAGQSDLDRFTP